LRPRFENSPLGPLRGRRIDEPLNGSINSVIGGLELAAGLLVLCWLPVEQAAGEGATDSLVEKDEPEGDAAFVDELVGVAMAGAVE
jgi:hypothetical protein